MGHEHANEESKSLGFFASPITDGSHSHAKSCPTSSVSSDIENQKIVNADEVPYDHMHDELQEDPSFHHHAEATTPELFYDLFFVANLTTFTSLLEINDSKSLTAYVGFFCLLWLTWYQVTLYDIRFSTDSVFERVAKALHYGVMVGFAVMGPQWKPGQEQKDYNIYRAFGIILLVSRLTLVFQYGTTLFFSRQYKKTVLPLAVIMGSTTVAAILYGVLTTAFPKIKYDAAGNYLLQKSDVYIVWYVIGLLEITVTVGVSMFWRVISFKGTHMVQRMSLLTLIVLGEGIIVICKAISKVVKNYILWTPEMIGQVIAAVLIIYFLYMLYFDSLHEEHFGSIKQQIWSFAHFPLHVCLVLALQGVSLLITWLQAIVSQKDLTNSINTLLLRLRGTMSPAITSGADFVAEFNQTVYTAVYENVPKGIDASKELKSIEYAWKDMAATVDSLMANPDNNASAGAQFAQATNIVFSSACKTLFETWGISLPSTKTLSAMDEEYVQQYVDNFVLVFNYVFIAVSGPIYVEIAEHANVHRRALPCSSTPCWRSCPSRRFSASFLLMHALLFMSPQQSGFVWSP